ncbi:hypothetical protein [uncultured Parabacteroides sp.]|uniref:hypothetical protein n=1 Tax=uncultured Parabacteroides sp. TaxID=512312 RepID=UPI0025CBB187|nr:hypothetical protein [uncultured Parabacteroides sp.]MCD7852273.1 hypothetical protein [Parabacteroides sp.]
MKKIVLALVVMVVACVVVFASQDVKCRQTTAFSSFEQATPDGFRKIDMQNLPHAVLRTMGTSSSYEGCTFEGAYMSGKSGCETYKIEVENPDRTERFVLMNGRGEVIG